MWYLLKTGNMPAAFNMALDEAIFRRHVEGALHGSIVRFYGWKPSAVSISYRQNIDKDINAEECERCGISVVRRITGGGAVFHDREITYSIVASVSSLSENITESFRMVSAALIAGLKKIGVKSEFSPVNDLISGGRKISGNAQARRGNSILQHGTILLGADLQRMFSLLNVPEKKVKEKGITKASDRVSSLENILGRKVSFQEAEEGLEAGFVEWFGELPSIFKPDDELLTLSRRLEDEKFSNQSWNRNRKLPEGLK